MKKTIYLTFKFSFLKYFQGTKHYFDRIDSIDTDFWQKKMIPHFLFNLIHQEESNITKISFSTSIFYIKFLLKSDYLLNISY